MNLQLLYKAFMELSRDRAEFLSRLFARPRPKDLTDKTPVEDLLDAYELAAPSDDLYRHYLQEATDHLTKTHKFALTQDDLRGLEYVVHLVFQGRSGFELLVLRLSWRRRIPLPYDTRC